MNVIPAIDLLGGECVRLTMGEYNRVTSYSRSPVDVAQRFTAAGATRIHLVDLDAAGGSGNNREVIRKIRQEVPVTLEVGGGVRREEDVEELLDIGIDRLVVGTILARTPEVVEKWHRRYGGVFIAAVDAKDGIVMVEGWEEGSGRRDIDFAQGLSEVGVGAIIYTNIWRDGTLSGPDINRGSEIARESGLPVVLSGGVGSLEDCLKATEAAALLPPPGICGIIVGKGLYENRLDLGEAIKMIQNPGDEKW